MSQYENALKKIAYGAITSTGFMGTTAVLAFLFDVVASRYLGAEHFGIFKLAQTLLAAAIPLVCLGIPQGIKRYIPYYQAKGEWKLLRGYLSFIFIYPFFTGIVLALVLIIFSEPITQFFGLPQVFSTALKFLALAIPLRSMEQAIRQITLSQKQVIRTRIGGMIRPLVLLGGALWASIQELPVTFLLALLLVIPIILLAYRLYTYMRLRFPKAKRQFRQKEWFAFSLPLLFTSMFGVFLTRIDQIVIAKFLTAESVGIYAIAFSMGNLLLISQRMLSTLFLPVVSELYAKEHYEMIGNLLRKSSMWIFSIAFTIWLIFSLHAEDLLSTLYGAEYAPGAPVLIILGAGFMLKALFGLNKHILTLHKRTNIIFYATAGMAIYNIAMNIILIPLMGIAGAAVATASTLFIQGLIFYWQGKRLEPLGLDWRAMGKVLVAGVITAVLVLILQQALPSSIIGLAASLATTGIVYAGLVLLFNPFTKEDHDILDAVEKRSGVNLTLIRRLMR